MPTSDQSARERIAWAVAVASEYVPNATCLTQALAALVLLQREGYGTCLRIGVARSAEGQFEAHAWLERDGRILVGGSGFGRYVTLLELKKDRTRETLFTAGHHERGRKLYASAGPSSHQPQDRGEIE